MGARRCIAAHAGCTAGAALAPAAGVLPPCTTATLHCLPDHLHILRSCQRWPLPACASLDGAAAARQIAAASRIGGSTHLGAEGDAHDGRQLVSACLHLLQGLHVAVEVQLLGGSAHGGALPAGGTGGDAGSAMRRHACRACTPLAILLTMCMAGAALLAPAVPLPNAAAAVAVVPSIRSPRCPPPPGCSDFSPPALAARPAGGARALRGIALCGLHGAGGQATAAAAME